MAWTSPMTAVTGNVFTAAQFNQHVRDNLNMTAPAVAYTSGNLIVTGGFRSVLERSPSVAFFDDFESTASTSYTDLAFAWPQVTVTSGTRCLMTVGAQMYNSIAGLGCRTTVALTGATTLAAADIDSAYGESGNVDDSVQMTWTALFTTNAGVNTFTQKYRVTAGGGTGTFGNRLVAIIPF